MTLAVTCPGCGAKCRLDESAVGKKFRCKQCGASVAVPSAATASPESGGSYQLAPPPSAAATPGATPQWQKLQAASQESRVKNPPGRMDRWFGAHVCPRCGDELFFLVAVETEGRGASLEYELSSEPVCLTCTPHECIIADCLMPATIGIRHTYESRQKSGKIEFVESYRNDHLLCRQHFVQLYSETAANAKQTGDPVVASGCLLAFVAYLSLIIWWLRADRTFAGPLGIAVVSIPLGLMLVGWIVSLVSRPRKRRGKGRRKRRREPPTLSKSLKYSVKGADPQFESD